MLLVTRRTLALGVDDGERETRALGKPTPLTADPLAGLLLGRPCRKRARQRHNRDSLIATVLDAYRRRRTPAARRGHALGRRHGAIRVPRSLRGSPRPAACASRTQRLRSHGKHAARVRQPILSRPVFDVSVGRPGEVGVHPDRDGPGMVPPRPPASAGIGGLVVSLSCEVPDSSGQLNSRKSRFPLRDRHLRTSGHQLGSRTANTAAAVSGARGTS